jgi:hypothetical protein
MLLEFFGSESSGGEGMCAEGEEAGEEAREVLEGVRGGVVGHVRDIEEVPCIGEEEKVVYDGL